MINTHKEIVEYCSNNNLHIYDLVIEEELKNSKDSEKEFKEKLLNILSIMMQSSISSINKKHITRFKMIDGFSKTFYDYQQNNDPLVGKELVRAMSYAFSTSECNAAMGKIVASPTAGSAGILPATMRFMKEKYNLDDDILINGLITSIGIGQVIGKYGNFAGAEGGCQAECGSASAMAAGAVVEMMNGTADQALQAASIALINVLGLVCDPIAGLVEYPCTFRNASGMMNALISADMALSGIKSIVPFEETVQAMKSVGDLMPESLRETGLGGIAGTKTGQKIRKEFLNLK